MAMFVKWTGSEKESLKLEIHPGTGNMSRDIFQVKMQKEKKRIKGGRQSPGTVTILKVFRMMVFEIVF